MLQARIYKAKVVSNVAGVLKVEIPKTFPGKQFPAEDYTGWEAVVATTTSTSGHTHNVTITRAPLETGDDVLVAFDQSDACVVVGRKV